MIFLQQCYKTEIPSVFGLIAGLKYKTEIIETPYPIVKWLILLPVEWKEGKMGLGHDVGKMELGHDIEKSGN